MAATTLRAVGFRYVRPGLLALRQLSVAAHAPFSSSAPRGLKQMPPRAKPPPEDEMEEFFLKGSGPGGQKINKTNSAVQLRHKPTGLVVKSQATRSRDQNRKIARALLAAKLDDMERGDASRSAVVDEVKRKRAASAAKKSRRKYRRLEEEAREDRGEDREGGDKENAGTRTRTGVRTGTAIGTATATATARGSRPKASGLASLRP